MIHETFDTYPDPRETGTAQQSIDDPTPSVSVLVLIGEPAAGKSTIVDVLEDIGVPCRDTGDAIRAEAHERYDGTDEPDEEYIWDVAGIIREEHGDAGPTKLCEDWIWDRAADGHDVVCISACRDQAEVDWLRDRIGTALVVKVAASDHTRSERYVEMHLDDTEGAIDRDRVHELRQELYDREHRERPYPRHDVTLRNDNDVTMQEQYEKLQHLLRVMQ